MKKLGMTLLAVALALPLTLAAQSPSTPATPQTPATKTKTVKTNKAKRTRKHHHKKGTQTNVVPPATPSK